MRVIDSLQTTIRSGTKPLCVALAL